MSDKAKDILLNESARLKISSGINKVARILNATFGIKIFDKNLFDFTSQTINEINLPDNFEKIGYEIAKQLHEKIKKKYLDGSALTIMILDAIIKDGIELLNNKIDHLSINKALDLGHQALSRIIDKMSTQITSSNDIYKIALTYSSNNQKIAEMITKCFQIITPLDEVILTDLGDLTSEIEITNGYQFNLDLASKYFYNDLKQKAIELNFCDILLVNQKVSSIQELLPILTNRDYSTKALLIIATDFQKDLISSLAINKLKKIFKIAVVEIPSKLNQKAELFNELSYITNAQKITNIGQNNLISNDILGIAKKVVIKAEQTLIIPTKPLLSHQSSFRKKIALVNSKIFSDAEVQTFAKGLSLTQLSLAHKVVAGGGISLFFAINELSSQENNQDLSLMINLLKNAFQLPFRQILKNAHQDVESIVKNILDQGYPNGFNLASNSYENLLKAKVFDSTKILKDCIAYAVDTAKKILLTDAIIVNSND
jgi:chaperonin GroEL